jgi:Zinc finger, ZZ type/EF-hand domain pair
MPTVELPALSRPTVVAVCLAVVCAVGCLYAVSIPSASTHLHRSNARRRHGRTDGTSNVRPARIEDGTVPSEPLNPTSAVTALEHAMEYEGDGEETEADMANASHQSNEHGGGLKLLLYHIAEHQNRQETIVHKGFECDVCQTSPIRGVRWKCLNCADVDLCSECEANDAHYKTHMLVKIKIPVPFIGSWDPKEVFYPGDSVFHQFHPPQAPLPVMKKISEKLALDRTELEALFEQFISLADESWVNDPSGIQRAISRAAFNRTFFIQAGPHPNSVGSNLVHDRIFRFWANEQDLIGFEEFVTNIVTLRYPTKHVLAKLIFEAIDLDNDGYISRNDFIRVFAAKYEIQKQLVRYQLTHSLAEKSKDSQNIVVERPLNRLLATGGNANYLAPSPNTVKPPNQYGETRSFASSGIGNDIPDMDFEDLTKDILPTTIRVKDIKEDSPELDTETYEWLKARREAVTSDSKRTFILNGRNVVTSSEPEGRIEGDGRAFDLGYKLPVESSRHREEVLYLVLRDGLNELLDPFFVEKERIAIRKQSTKIKRDMTWPQFRPLNQEELERLPHSEVGSMESFVGSPGSRGAEALPVRLSFGEFTALMESDSEKRLHFIWSWFNICNF